MKRHFANCCVPAAIALTVFCFICMPTVAQKTGPDVATPRTADGHPDMSGFYNGALGGAPKSADGSIDFVLGGAPRKDADATRPPRPAAPPPAFPMPPYKPEFAAKSKAIADSSFGPTNRVDPQLSCLPLGIPRIMRTPFQIFQIPGQMAILFESLTGPAFRIIPTDGRSHPKDVDSTFLGDSVGHWEGDTLVVDVVGLNDQTWLGGGEGAGAGPAGLIHSDQEHVVERYTRKGDTLTYEATVEDPVMLTKPWVITPRRFKIGDANDGLEELICMDSDKFHVTGPDH